MQMPSSMHRNASRRAVLALRREGRCQLTAWESLPGVATAIDVLERAVDVGRALEEGVPGGQRRGAVEGDQRVLAGDDAVVDGDGGAAADHESVLAGDDAGVADGDPARAADVEGGVGVLDEL